jgi:dTDP-glucose 4,6-dehydratase
MDTILVTGGAGFIGSAFVLRQRRRAARIVNLDKLTYAGNLGNLVELKYDPDHLFIRGDLADPDLLAEIFQQHQPRAVVNFAAESHVDRSIVQPDDFIQTNVVGLFQLLQAALNHWRGLAPAGQKEFVFIQVSTDEVYGELGPDDPAFNEQTPYAPRSPYSASKAAGDHLARAYHHTYGLPAIITNCSNNYGPRQFPEKLIPLMILNALEGKPLPVYGRGENVRDWLHVEDHCRALEMVLERGRPGETYTIGGGAQMSNLEVVRLVCAILDRLRPDSPHRPHQDLITYVGDRPGHDFRYAIDSAKIAQELGWRPELDFARGLEDTVKWYLDNAGWVESVRTGQYTQWLELNYAGRGPAPLEPN